MADWYCDWTAGNDTTGDGSIGNPYKTIQKCVDSSSTGDNVYAKNNGTYLEQVTVTDKGLKLEGYGSTVGDGIRAIIDGESSRATCITITNSAINNIECRVRNFELKNATGDGLTFIRVTGGATSYFSVTNVYSHNNGAHGLDWDWNNTSPSRVTNSIFTNNSGDGIHSTAGGVLVISGCVCLDNTGTGIAGNSEYTVTDTLCHNNAINISGCNRLINCTLDAASGSDNWAPSNQFHSAFRCGFTNAAAYGVDNTVGSDSLFIDCGFYNNTTAKYRNTPDLSLNEITSDPQYTNAASDDFSLGASSPWRQLSRVIGDQAGSMATYPDIGAQQSQSTAGGFADLIDAGFID